MNVVDQQQQLLKQLRQLSLLKPVRSYNETFLFKMSLFFLFLQVQIDFLNQIMLLNLVVDVRLEMLQPQLAIVSNQYFVENNLHKTKLSTKNKNLLFIFSFCINLFFPSTNSFHFLKQNSPHLWFQIKQNSFHNTLRFYYINKKKEIKSLIIRMQ